jgi:hypothetical protein
MIKSKKAVPGLVRMLDSEWIRNRRYAVVALGAIGDPAAVPALEKLLTHASFPLRSTAAAALRQIDGEKREIEPEGAAAVIPELAPAKLNTPGGKRPPQFIVLGVDDCAGIEGIESMLDIVETLGEHDVKAVFTMWLAPLAGDYESRDLLKQTLILQRLFDLGSEVAHHTLHHNPGGHNWRSLPKEQQIEEIDGCVQWYRDNIDGFTRPFAFKSGGGGRGDYIDREFSLALINKQNFLYGGRRGRHPNDQQWPATSSGYVRIPTGCIDGDAPPVHADIANPIRSDYPGQFEGQLRVSLQSPAPTHNRRQRISRLGLQDARRRHLQVEPP